MSSNRKNRKFKSINLLVRKKIMKMKHRPSKLHQTSLISPALTCLMYLKLRMMEVWDLKRTHILFNWMSILLKESGWMEYLTESVLLIEQISEVFKLLHMGNPNKDLYGLKQKMMEKGSLMNPMKMVKSKVFTESIAAIIKNPLSQILTNWFLPLDG